MATKTKEPFINAHDVYDLYRIPRGLLQDLVRNGTVERRGISIDKVNILYRYSSDDIERFLNAAPTTER